MLKLANYSSFWKPQKAKEPKPNLENQKRLYTGCINKPKKFLKVTLESFGKSLMVPLACQ